MVSNNVPLLHINYARIDEIVNMLENAIYPVQDDTINFQLGAQQTLDLIDAPGADRFLLIGTIEPARDFVSGLQPFTGKWLNGGVNKWTSILPTGSVAGQSTGITHMEDINVLLSENSKFSLFNTHLTATMALSLRIVWAVTPPIR